MRVNEGEADGQSGERRFIYLLTVAQRRVQQWGREPGETLTPAQAGVLFTLILDEGAPMGEIARALGMGAPGLSGLVDRMEAAGLVRREPDPRDGRAARVFLTDAGRTAREAARARAGAVNARLVEGFTEEELDVVARWLTHVGERFNKGSKA